MKRFVWLAVSLVLAAIIALSVIRPQQMVSPGNLIPAHSSLAGDCFACHAPFRGASAERCMACHTLADIGVRTTKGVAIVRSGTRPAFHQALSEPDCLACHSDHPGPLLTDARSISFNHALLKPDARSRCQSCHNAPQDEFHAMQTATCSTCHQLPRWKPATFNHSGFFELDRHHNTTCSTCHPRGDYKRYSCYGCHEHQPAQIIAEHREEGMTNIANCVRCHRSSRGEPEEKGDHEADDD